MIPTVFPGKMEDSEIKRRTNFGSEAMILLFVFVICNGDVDLMTYMQYSIPWYEK